MVSDSSQAVSIDTPNCKEAKCRITNSEGIYHVAETLALITINKAFGGLTLICEKNGKSEISVHKFSANVATFGNILLGDIPGALIDGGTESGYDYPTNIVNNLSCEKPSSDESKKTPLQKVTIIGRMLRPNALSYNFEKSRKNMQTAFPK